MLSNPNFVAKAPQTKIDREKEKLESYKRQYGVVLQQLADITK